MLVISFLLWFICDSSHYGIQLSHGINFRPVTTMNRLPLTPFFLVILLFTGIASARAQSTPVNSACELPPFSKIVNDPNIFSEQQEEWLGEILDPQIQKHFHIIADPEGNYLQNMGLQ